MSLTERNPIDHFGPSHLAALGVTLGIFLLMWRWHRNNSPMSRPAERFLVAALLLQHPIRLGISWWLGILDADSYLPLHLCDVAAIFGACALIWKKQLFIEFTYFWGLSGTLNGLISPNLQWDFPHPLYFTFFLWHSGVVIAALYLTLAWRHWPRAKGIWLSMLGMLGYAAVASIANYTIGSNYGFLRQRPDNPSLLDKLPEPPAHFFHLTGLALAFFIVLYTPFFLAKLRRKRNQAEP